MLFHPKNVAPEPYFGGAMYLLYRVALFIRNDSQSISPQQLSDLGEAIHDVPESLTEYGKGFDERKIREWFLARYDEKWATKEGAFSLLRTLDVGMKRSEEWNANAGREPR